MKMIFKLILLEFFVQICEAYFVKFDKAIITTSSWSPMLIEKNVRSMIQCSVSCIHNEECTTFKYDQVSLECQLGRKSQTMPVFNNVLQPGTMSVFYYPGFFKIMVVGGTTGPSDLSSVEVIDLESSTTVCANFNDYPNVIRATVGGLVDGMTPLICGGGASNDAVMKNVCNYYTNHAWINAPPMISARNYAAGMASSPFQNQSHKFFITGGIVPLTSEVLVDGKWEIANAPMLPMTVGRSCITFFDKTAPILVAGSQNLAIGGKSFVFNPDGWKEGPSVTPVRYGPGCGRILRNSRENKYSIILVGGGIAGTSTTDSVGIWDEGTNQWRNGPTLPKSLCCFSLIETPRGGVVVIGGINDKIPSSNIYRLRHAEATWELLGLNLKTARYWHTAFLIPDNITTCN